MQSKANPRPRRRPVARHPGIYYRPQPGGRVGPPYEISYLDSTGKRRWAVVHGSLDDAEPREPSCGCAAVGVSGSSRRTSASPSMRSSGSSGSRPVTARARCTAGRFAST